MVFINTLLIAEPSDIFAEQLIKQLQDQFVIVHCKDGETALEHLAREKPDYLVLNLMLPFKDGFTLLQETPHKPQKILAMTSLCTPYIEERSSELGIDMLLIRPTPSTTQLRLLDLVNNRCSTPHADLHDCASYLLTLLRFPAQGCSYQALCQAIILYREDADQILSGALYPTIAKTCNCHSAGAVEQGIRRLIKQAWRRKNDAVWSKYFDPEGKCPTNREFIARMAQELP